MMLTIRGSNIFLLLTIFAYHFTASTPLQKAALNARRSSVHTRKEVKPAFLGNDSREDSNVYPYTAERNGPLVKRRVSNGLSMESYDKILSRGRILRSFAGAFLLAAAFCIINLFEGSSLAFESMSVLAERLLHNYMNSMVRYPLQTKVATGGFLAVLGDAIAQARESDEYDPRRAASFATFDSCYRVFQHNAFPTIVGLCQGRFLGSLLSAIPTLTVGSNQKLFLAALERTMMYQLCVIPLFYYPVFFTFTGFLQGLSLKGTFQRAKANFLPCWKRNLMFWIPIQLVMFGLIDEKWQIPFVCGMGLIWSTILSVTAGSAKDTKQPSR
jgi:hypothetical protein